EDASEQYGFEFGHNILSSTPRKQVPALACAACSMVLQLRNQRIDFIARDVGAAGVINQHSRGAFAHTNALGKLHRDLAVGGRIPRLYVELLANVAEHFFAVPKRTCQPATDPQARLAEFFLFGLAKDAVEAHRVVDFRGAEVQHVGDFADGLGGDVAHFVLHDVQ